MLAKPILCVVSAKQREEIESELKPWLPSGHVMTFESSPEWALELMAEVEPDLVLVGVDVGEMEWVEFVARLRRRYPDFSRELIVLPEMNDPFPPIHVRFDVSSGQRITKWVSFEAVKQLIGELHGRVYAVATGGRES